MDALPRRLEKNVIDLFGAEGVRWTARLPEIVARCARRWSLIDVSPVEDLSYNYVAWARRADGTAVALKIGVPNPELTSEIEALLQFEGGGCVRLLEVSREDGAFLLERLEPGMPLARVEDDGEATRIAARVMRQLWRPVGPEHPFPTTSRWALGLERLRRHFDGGTGPLTRDLVEKAEDLFGELLASADRPVLLHGDLHHWNILRAERQPWLAIDPKGLVGEPAYEVGALLRNFPDRLLERARLDLVVVRRVEILAGELGFEPTRILGWGLAQAVLAAWWCIEDHGGGWEGFIQAARLMDEVMGTLA